MGRLMDKMTIRVYLSDQQEADLPRARTAHNIARMSHGTTIKRQKDIALGDLEDALSTLGYRVELSDY